MESRRNHFEILSQELDLQRLAPEMAQRVRDAFVKRGEVAGYIANSEETLSILRSQCSLFEARGTLEFNLMDAYLHSSSFSSIPLDELQALFDRCDRSVLQSRYPIPPGETFTLFRGVAGPHHRIGMSWIDSLSKAIWYAAQHSAYRGLSDRAVYTATLLRSEIYCCGDHYDNDFIARPTAWQRVDVSESGFRLDRPR